MFEKYHRETELKKMKSLVTELNHYSEAYYNDNKSLITDREFDDKFDELKMLEDKYGVIMANSPTQNVGFVVNTKLNKVIHNHPMLSLDKTKDINVLLNFIKEHNRDCLLMNKMDGLTISIRYVKGRLFSAETRGNGTIGEDVTDNVKQFTNVPLYIDIHDELIVDGEAIIDYDTFTDINANLAEAERYSNPRNLASGSVRQLDSKVTKERKMKFIAWKCVTSMPFTTSLKDKVDNSFTDRLLWLAQHGFDVVPFVTVFKEAKAEDLKLTIGYLKTVAENNNYPIDGLVLGIDDIEYSKSLGYTAHHNRSQLAFKFYDEVVETNLINIEWSAGKTGTLNPVAVFEPVDIDGAIVERASLSNVSVMNETLGLPYIGQTVYVSRRNSVIPKIEEGVKWEDKTITPVGILTIPDTCPICGETTEVITEKNSAVLICTNDNCHGKLLGKLTHFVSRNAMNIEGLSESTLEKFINKGWLNNFVDIYNLHHYSGEIEKLEGFGQQSTAKLLTAIEESKKATLANFINALSVPMIGFTNAKIIAKNCGNSVKTFLLRLSQFYPWYEIAGLGYAVSDSINEYYMYNADLIEDLASLMTFKVEETNTNGVDLSGKTFVITGKLETYENRDALVNEIENYGGKVAGSVSKKTNYLINNDTESNSSKNKKAKDLGVKIISEQDFLIMISRKNTEANK